MRVRRKANNFYFKKNIDASVITVIGYPAFAAHDANLIKKSISKCIRRLKGNYGFKRFLRDGCNSVLENKKQKFYDISEIKVSIIIE